MLACFIFVLQLMASSYVGPQHMYLWSVLFLTVEQEEYISHAHLPTHVLVMAQL